MSTPVKIGLAIVALIGVSALTWFGNYPHSPLGKQEANLRLAENHQPKAEASLRELPGADRIRVGVYTGLGGSLAISGDVANDQTAKRVISAVLASDPPVTVQFLLTVGETNIIRKVVEQSGGGNSRPALQDER